MKDIEKVQIYLKTLCSVKPNRRTGSPGNTEATNFFSDMIKKWDFEVDTTSFPCLDYESSYVSLTCRDKSYKVYVSQFSPSCQVTAKLVTVSTIVELENCRCEGNILLMRGDLCTEHLMPKNFVFYNPDRHKKIFALLEKKKPAAVIAATEKNPEMAGALYPFPLIEDGDFNIPSVYCTGETGNEIITNTGEHSRLIIEARRIHSSACNVVARKNCSAQRKIILCAHIDAYWSTPGAVDNASGIIVLLLTAERLKDFHGKSDIEIIAFNGEDYYSAGGEMDYLKRYGQDLKRTTVAVNIDGIGYKEGNTAYSLYECSDEISRPVRHVFAKYKGIKEGEQWPQSDHMIFVQNGIPAIAATSEKLAEMMSGITHTPEDTPDMVDCEKLVETANALYELITYFES